jgi:hypothetical protein
MGELSDVGNWLCSRFLRSEHGSWIGCGLIRRRVWILLRIIGVIIRPGGWIRRLMRTMTASLSFVLHNVRDKRAGRTSEWVKTCARRVFHLLLLIIQQYLVTMPSKTEGRVSLALQAYDSHQLPSLRAAANAYDVPFETLRRRHSGTQSRADTTTSSRKFSNNEEQVLLRKILQLSAEGFPPQRAIVEEMANTMLRTKNPSGPQRVGMKWVTNFVKRHSELSSVYNRKAEATPSPRSSQTFWNPQTPKTIPGIKKQGQLVLTENRKRRRSSASSAEKPFQQLLKAFETVVHENALLMAEAASLRAENQHQKQKRARKNGYIRQEGSITIQDSQESARKRMVKEQSTDNTENIDPVLLNEQLRSVRKKAPSKCSRCGLFEHNARTCSL